VFVCGHVTEGVVITVAWPCLLNDQLFGVAGLEVYMNDVLEPVTYYQEDSSYAFIMDKRGLNVTNTHTTILWLSEFCLGQPV